MRRGFFAELKRRHVYRAGVIYAMTAWLLIQVATQVFPFFNVANWVIRLIVVVFALGFPVALTIAWVYEITPAGVVKTDDLPDPKPPRKRRFRFDIVIIAV
ncbi:MAG TPA: hypothetical protein VII74_07090, partial [Chthoniobacterales bacterium]